MYDYLLTYLGEGLAWHPSPAALMPVVSLHQLLQLHFPQLQLDSAFVALEECETATS